VNVPSVVPPAADALLEVVGLTARYGPVAALRQVSLDIRAGEIVALLGTNGAGKSTCLNSIVGLHDQREGQIRFCGKDISRTPAEAVVRLGIALCPEGRKIFSALTVEENLVLGAAVLGLRRAEAVSRAQRYYDLFPILGARRALSAGSLSGGEQQQLAIARAMMSQPTLLLLDEPSLGLAPKLVKSMFGLIARLRTEESITILVVEQNVRQALEICDRAYVLSTGSIALSGRAADLRESGDIDRAVLGLA